ncbi:anaerobic ribonucleoside-triphosphate reductase [Cupriavidus pauculus]|uniref:Uncharacterized protein n=1 Tax=Cupriavidus pauculus TaxID=82633 RepID=A0A2N5CFI7_9BURK|nr:anaerobic ribonucleoside-triphosphate reductase [Cupriavidus pauculus]PLQ00955.1 hypothetical protein CYJ10_08610 [Cupriavidus pauculus]
MTDLSVSQHFSANTANAADTVALRDDERQPCEVWTRVMGYHRPVESFNIGKKGEHAERRFFDEQRCQG